MNRRRLSNLLCLGMSSTLLLASASADEARIASHPPLRVPPTLASRPLPAGPAWYVSPQGDDRNHGTQERPWKTIGHAIARLKAGDTLLLRAGAYYENMVIRLLGRADAPITLRSFPGETAVIDGGLREFFESPNTAWEPFAQGVDGEYRSTRTYPNLRHVLGSFGDSMVGLVAYYHAMDVRAPREEYDPDPATKDWKPIYCGPGIWYDAESGRIHARLAHTHLPEIANYRGETDPRKLPLVLAPFRSTPLHVDGAQHIRFQDLTIRGAGYDSILLDQSRDIEFDNITVWCGSNGVRATGALGLKIHRSGFYGSIPPWLSRGDSSLQSYPGRPERDIARLNTHVLLAPEAGPESSVYAFPFNDDWEISRCEFTDASDGLYLGGVSMKFHRNLVDGMQDDGLYLSPMYRRYERLLGKATIHISQNLFRRGLTMLAYGGPETITTDQVYFSRNIIDLRAPVNVGTRPRADSPQPYKPYAGHVMGDHGSPPWPAFISYHNTIISREPSRYADFLFTTGATADRPRRAFNNLYLHGSGLKTYNLPASEFIQSDGNLYWQPDLDSEIAAAFLAKFRASPAFENSRKVYPPGFESSSVVADPKFVKFSLATDSINDYGLQPDSPAVDAGVAIPVEWPDALRSADTGKPDIGAIPRGGEFPAVGRSARP